MNNVLLWIGGILVAMLAALFTVPHFVDWTSYRGVFEEEASRVIGREVRVAGAVNLRLLPTPYVRFEKVRLADAAGQTGEPFFRADDFTLWLAPGPLLRGAIEAREVELRRPTLKLRLNAQGGGNWQTLSLSRASMPFVPNDVTLQSVQITDGTISIDDATGAELARVGNITGDLSVAALEGPFKFKGSYSWNGERHELKSATAPFEPDGSLRINAQVTSIATTNTYTLDGRLTDLGAKASFDGQLSGVIGVARMNVTATNGASASPLPQRIPIEVRSPVTADAKGAKLSDISLSFDQDGKPQMVSGNAQIAWQGGLDVRTDLATRWVDLDHLLGSAATSRPLEAAQRVAPALGSLLPSTGRGRTSFKADQVTLGGESISGFDLLVESENGALRLTDLQAALPGGTRVRLNGTLPAFDSFDGEVNLRGANLARLLAWLGHGAVLAEARTEGAFSLKSKLVLTPKSVAVRDAFASIGAAVVTGGVSYAWTERPRLDVVIDGDLIDLGLAFPRALDLHALIGDLGGTHPKAPPSLPADGKQQSAGYVIDTAKQDASLRIRAARLLDAERDFRDVDVDATLINGRLNLQRMRFVSATGLEVEAEGEVGGGSAHSRTNLRGTIAAADKSAMSELVELLDQSGIERASLLTRMSVLAPARVAWTLAAGDGKDNTRAPATVWLDGAVLGRRLKMSARLDGGLQDWRQHNLTLDLALERPDWQRLRSLLAVDPSLAKSAASSQTPPIRSRLTMKLSGRPDQSLGSYLKLEDDAFDASLSGKIALGTGTVSATGGELQLRAADLAQALSALGFATGNWPLVAIDGAAELTLKDGILKITPAQLEVAGAVVGGELLVSRVDGKDRHRIEGRLSTTQATIPRLLDLFTDRRAARSGEPQLWQSAAFDFSLLNKVEGRVRVEAAELNLAPEVSLSRAVIVAEFATGKIDILTLDGEMLGTTLTSRWVLEKAAAGASLTGNAKVEGIALDKLGLTASGAPPLLAGKASVAAAASGRGLSPQGLVSALMGKGELSIFDARTTSVSPLIARRITEQVIKGQLPATIEAVEQSVVAMMSDPSPEFRLALGTRRLAFDIADGAVKIAGFTIDHADGRASNRTTMELATLKIDSEWKIEEQTPKPATNTGGVHDAGPLPPVTIVFLGPAARLGRLDKVVSVDALVRELGVRRMERDVEELERLRRLDEERAKAEAERRRVETEARSAAANAGAAAMPAPPGPWVPIIVPASPPQPDAQQAGTPGAADGSPPPATTEPAKAPDRRRTTSTGSSQVPSSQQFKNRIQDVFKNQNSR